MSVRANLCLQVTEQTRIWAEIDTDADYRPDVADDVANRTRQLLFQSAVQLGVVIRSPEPELVVEEP